MRKTQKLVNKLLAELERTGIPLTACSKAGISRSTYYRWRQDDIGFRIQADEAVLIGRENVTDLAESKLIKNISDGNERAIEYYLRHNDPRYKEFKQVELGRILVERSKGAEESIEHLNELASSLYSILTMETLENLAGHEESHHQSSVLDERKIDAGEDQRTAARFIQAYINFENERRSKTKTTPNNSNEDTVQ